MNGHALYRSSEVEKATVVIDYEFYESKTGFSRRATWPLAWTRIYYLGCHPRGEVRKPYMVS